MIEIVMSILEYIVLNSMYIVVMLIAWSVPQPTWARFITDRIKKYALMGYAKVKSYFVKAEK